MNETETFKNFIDIVKDTAVKHKAELKKTGGTMAVIDSFCQRGHYENYHSNLLSYLLNPKEDHRHDSEYLKLFLKHINIPIGIIDMVGDGSGINVRREAPADGRIDILIKSDFFVVVIENKIWAGDQPEQLNRYYESFKNTYKTGENLFMVYLTPYGWEASENSKGELDPEQVINISYEKHILNWLNQLPSKQNEPLIKSALDQYIYTVQKLTGQTPEEMNLMSNIKEVLLKDIDKVGLEDIKNLEKVMFDLVLERTFIEIKRKLESKLINFSYEEIKYDMVGNYIGVSLPILYKNTSIRFEIERKNKKATYVIYGIYGGKEIPELNKIIPIDGWKTSQAWYCYKFIALDNIDSIVDAMFVLYQTITSNKS